MFVTLRKQYANSEDSPEAVTHLPWLDEVVAFCGQYLSEGFWGGDQQSLHVEHVSANDSAI